MLICLADLGLEFLQGQTSNGQHWARGALSTYNSILNDARLHRSDRKLNVERCNVELSSSQAGIEKPKRYGNIY